MKKIRKVKILTDIGLSYFATRTGYIHYHEGWENKVACRVYRTRWGAREYNRDYLRYAPSHVELVATIYNDRWSDGI